LATDTAMNALPLELETAHSNGRVTYFQFHIINLLLPLSFGVFF